VKVLYFVQMTSDNSIHPESDKPSGDSLISYQTVADNGQSPFRKRLHSSESRCEVAASETWLSTLEV
jgi:hypothetical protein